MRAREAGERLEQCKHARECARAVRTHAIAREAYHLVAQLNATIRELDERHDELENDRDWRDRALALRYKEICEREPLEARRRWGPTDLSV